MPDQTIGPYVVGEKPPPLEYSFLDSSGSPINLTGYTATLRIQRKDSAVYTEGLASVSVPLSGTVTHTWTGTEFGSAGVYWLEFWAGNGTNRYASQRLETRVRLPVGPVPAV